jgi:hypothetical protein
MLLYATIRAHIIYFKEVHNFMSSVTENYKKIVEAAQCGRIMCAPFILTGISGRRLGDKEGQGCLETL